MFKEWEKIDYYRVNKFAALVKDFLTVCIEILQINNYNKSVFNIFIINFKDCDKVNNAIYRECFDTTNGKYIQSIIIYKNAVSLIT